MVFQFTYLQYGNVLFNTCYYVKVENGALLRDAVQSWKIFLGGYGKSWKIVMEKVWEPCKCIDIVGWAAGMASPVKILL